MSLLPKNFTQPIVITSILLLQGCGQSGPLYLPGGPPPITVPKEINDKPLDQPGEPNSNIPIELNENGNPYY